MITIISIINHHLSTIFCLTYRFQAHLKNAHNVSLDFFDERHEVLVYDREEYDAEATDIVQKISEKRKLADRIQTGELNAKPMATIGKDVKVYYLFL